MSKLLLIAALLTATIGASAVASAAPQLLTNCAPATASGPNVLCRTSPGASVDASFSIGVPKETVDACKDKLRFAYRKKQGNTAPATGTDYECTLAQDKASYLCARKRESTEKLDDADLVASCSDRSVKISNTAEEKTESRVTLDEAAGTGSEAPRAAAQGPSILSLADWENVLRSLNLPLKKQRVGHYYDASADVAVLFFDSDATPYFPLPDKIDEDDDIFIVVVDTQARLDNAEVSLTGCSRTPSGPRVFGKMSDVIGLASGGRKKAEAPKLLPAIVRAVGKCEGADTGGPLLSVRNGKNETHTATIPINRLYRLAVGLAAGFDFTRDRSFDLRTAPGETIPRVAQSRDMQGITSLVYISAYFAARDFRKTDAIAQRFQGFVALEPTHLTKSLTVGLGFEVTQGLNVLLGWRLAQKQTVLAEGSNLRNGSEFDGSRADLPTRERWEIGLPFVGVGLSSDLLARIR